MSYTKHLSLFILLAWSLSTAVFGQTGYFEDKLTTVSNVSVTINNLGMFGNAFRGSYSLKSFPSAQFPRRSSIEHVFQGGFWIGGFSAQGREIRVTTGAFESANGYSPGSSNFEFFSVKDSDLLREISSLRQSGTKYNSKAVSHQDFISEFQDFTPTPFVPGTRIPLPSGHNPLFLKVRCESYNWSSDFSNYYVILNYTVRNAGTDTISNIYTGLWGDGVVRNVARTAPGGTPFFDKGGNGYIDSLHLGYEFDANGDTATTRSFVAFKYLGATDKAGFRYPAPKSPLAINQNYKVNYNTWRFGSTAGEYQPPRNDQDRFGRLSTGLNTDPVRFAGILDEIRLPGNRSTLVSNGPFTMLLPGDSMVVTYALVFARMNEDGRPIGANTLEQKRNLIENARKCQLAYNGNDLNYDGIPDDGKPLKRYLVPEAPDAPTMKVVPRDNAIDIYWARNAELSVDPLTQRTDFEGYRLYMSRFGFDIETRVDLEANINLIKEWDRKGNNYFLNTGFDDVRLATPLKFEGDTTTYYYKYTIGNVANGWQYVLSLTAFDTGEPTENIASSESSRLVNQVRVFPGKGANADMKSNAPFVYPNPYYGEAAWEGKVSNRPEDKRLVFANLPAHCTVRIFSSAGDFIDEFIHKSDTYAGQDSRWYNTFAPVSDPNNPGVERALAGGEHSWDLLSRNSQIIARGLYLFAVEDHASGRTYKGNFTIIK